MNDDFNQTLWDLVADSPDLQEAIKKSMAAGKRGYSIPTGCITVSIQEEEHKFSRPELLKKLIEEVNDLTIGELDLILDEVKVELDYIEHSGGKLSPYEKTLLDIDIVALAVTILGRSRA